MNTSLHSLVHIQPHPDLPFVKFRPAWYPSPISTKLQSLNEWQNLQIDERFKMHRQNEGKWLCILYVRMTNALQILPLSKGQRRNYNCSDKWAHHTHAVHANATPTRMQKKKKDAPQRYIAECREEGNVGGIAIICSKHSTLTLLVNYLTNLKTFWVCFVSKKGNFALFPPLEIWNGFTKN